MGGGARFAMYCSLNSLESCVNDVTWPSERLINQSIAVPTNVLMKNLHCTASNPPTPVRWASRSSTPVKVALGPTNVAGITVSMIACENGIGKSLGSVSGSCSSTSRSPVWFRKSLRNSSLVLCNSSFLASDAARSIWIRSWFALDAATVSWRACIVSMICCRVRLSPPFGATDPCLVFLILMDLSSILVNGTMF